MSTSLPIDYDKRLMLFSGRANPELAVKIANRLNVDLGPVTLKTFSNGEVYCRFDESIRGADVFIVQPTNPPAENLIELMLLIDAARRDFAAIGKLPEDEFFADAFTFSTP